jgi:hypothetical protein
VCSIGARRHVSRTAARRHLLAAWAAHNHPRHLRAAWRACSREYDRACRQGTALARGVRGQWPQAADGSRGGCMEIKAGVADTAGNSDQQHAPRPHPASCCCCGWWFGSKRLPPCVGFSLMA